MAETSTVDPLQIIATNTINATPVAHRRRARLRLARASICLRQVFWGRPILMREALLENLELSRGPELKKTDVHKLALWPTCLATRRCCCWPRPRAWMGSLDQR